jgi:hypothetical protein
MGRFVLVVAAIAALSASGCDKGKGNSEGLPPAKEWGQNPSGDLPPIQQQGAPNNPHAGAAMGGAAGANPHAGIDMSGGGDNPHAGIDMSGGGGDNPHAGGGGTDVTQLGLPAPDPNRAIDPAHHVRGVIRVHEKAKSRVAAGGTVFVIIKKAGPDGAPSGPPVAVDKLTWQNGDLPFEMTERQAMIAGTELTGDVVVTARYDQDGDALSKQPGDITGSIRVKIPADNVTLTLDDVLN